MTRGVLLAGGLGTRLRPMTNVVNKHVLPVYDRPMIYYPIQTLQRLGVEELLIVSGREHLGTLCDLLGSGASFGMEFTYRVQDQPGGIAQALSLAEGYIRKADLFPVILGDNIFSNQSFTHNNTSKATIFTKEVEDVYRFGQVTDDDSGKVKGIIEKPAGVTRGKAQTGLYFYNRQVFEEIRRLQPSRRGELEITDVNNAYAQAEMIDSSPCSGFWSDAGTPDSLLKAAEYVQAHPEEFQCSTKIS